MPDLTIFLSGSLANYVSLGKLIELSSLPFTCVSDDLSTSAGLTTAYFLASSFGF